MAKKNDLRSIKVFIFKQVSAGKDRYSIADKVIKMGVDETVALELVDSVFRGDYVEQYDDFRDYYRKRAYDKITLGSLLLALLGGIGGTCLVGFVWASLTNSTGHDLEVLAWIVGVFSGLGVSFFSLGQKGISLKFTAVFCTILGIIIAKYISYQHFLKKGFTMLMGKEVAAKIGTTELIYNFIDDFFDYIIELVANLHLDLLWIILGIATAWLIPQRR